MYPTLLHFVVQRGGAYFYFNITVESLLAEAAQTRPSILDFMSLSLKYWMQTANVVYKLNVYITFFIEFKCLVAIVLSIFVNVDVLNDRYSWDYQFASAFSQISFLE